MTRVDYDSRFFVQSNNVYAEFSDKLGWGLYAKAPIRRGEGLIKLQVRDLLDCRLQRGPTFGDCSTHGITIAPNVEWCPTERHPFWNFNHSCDANCGFTRWGYIVESSFIPIIALDDISQDTHLTIDYSLTITVDEGMAGAPWMMSSCLCGAPNCRGVISEFRLLDKRLKTSLLSYRQSETRYGGVLAHVINEEEEMVAYLHDHSSLVFCDYLEVLVQQLNFSRLFLENSNNLKRTQDDEGYLR